MTASTVAGPWIVRPLSVVPQGDQFLVGDSDTGTFVLLPDVGVVVLDGLRAGVAPDALAAVAMARAGEPVDIAAFVDALQELGFVSPADAPDATHQQETAGIAPDPTPSTRPVRARLLDGLAHAAYGRVAWTGYATAALVVIALLLGRPSLWPRVSDLFFLSTPARSLAALTLLTYLLALAHEGGHWLAARAIGVPASVSIGRRLYALTLETDLTGLYAVPSRRRFGPLLAGMAFDTTVLAAVLTTRAAEGWADTSRSGGVAGLLAALTFVQVAALGTQLCVFVRTDVYALLVCATGCVDLYRTTQLSVLQATRLARPRHLDELAAAPARDRQVARWYGWLWLPGMGLAAWSFVVYFLPAVLRTVAWMAAGVTAAGPGTERFWEACALAVVLLSPTLLTGAVLARDLRRRLAREPLRGSRPRFG